MIYQIKFLSSVSHLNFVRRIPAPSVPIRQDKFHLFEAEVVGFCFNGVSKLTDVLYLTTGQYDGICVDGVDYHGGDLVRVDSLRAGGEFVPYIIPPASANDSLEKTPSDDPPKAFNADRWIKDRRTSISTAKGIAARHRQGVNICIGGRRELRAVWKPFAKVWDWVKHAR